MSDSIDRVFVHALNTVKKIPKTGAARPPPSDRMRLYGLYKQAMEGDVDGVMERPSATSATGAGSSSEDLVREQDKWDAWNSQKGLSRTEAKRRYVEALIETMHKYANTPNALELVAELEFVWNQVKSNSPSSTGSSSGQSGAAGAEQRGGGGGSSGVIASPVVRRFQPPLSGSEGPMKVLSPMSEEDESERRMAELADQAEDDPGEEYARRNDKRSKRMERAIVRLSAEIAALREQIATGREWRSRKERGVFAWFAWSFWAFTKHVTIDLVILLLLLLWMRKRRDPRLEGHVRAILRLAREYVRKILPAR
ncbi:acyl CoA binding protein-domain-containing protein [Achaetomium macrosporum]|uniref:Acyl CoA binding protein-domain-containing protein n=1 Tax=Achaetomium macrosporum TaxID=79813 RepID=A0AAN7C998_9PEZI|nr:acyl CoA binding protein-domain-containing protein [Achaetomium macrosporum]